MWTWRHGLHLFAEVDIYSMYGPLMVLYVEIDRGPWRDTNMRDFRLVKNGQSWLG